MFTIFTPTYNRAHLLSRLYKSLLEQTCQNFEWLIVDDGSVDNTHEIVEQMVNDRILKIRYIKKVNGGKHTAINLGVKEAIGAWFFIVDSDDYLTKDALQKMNIAFESLNANPIVGKQFAGVSGLCAYPDGKIIGGEVSYNQLDADPFQFRYIHKVRGDKAEVFFTKILRKYPFPEIKGEKFCPEALVWNRIGNQYLIRYLPVVTYYRDYQNGGLSDTSILTRRHSPKATSQYYQELSRAPIPIIQKLKAGISYWRFSIFDKSESIFKKMFAMNIVISLLTFPIGLLLANNDTKNINSFIKHKMSNDGEKT